MRKILSVFILIVAISPAGIAQNFTTQRLDSLYTAFVKLKSMNGKAEESNQIANAAVADTKPVKCGMSLVSEVKFNIDKFNLKQQMVLRSLFERPSSDTSFVTPSGFFRVHYLTDAINKPGYSLDSLALAIDSAYNFEVNYLGYPAPPRDQGEGGDDLYDIYLKNLGNMYGYTEPEEEIIAGSNKYYTYIVIDNDFAGSAYNTRGINAARVTVAHEMHHAIQMGDYIYRSSDQYFYELTSTAMEDFVFTTVNDYYAYMPAYFEHPSARSFTSFRNYSNDGYDLAVWDIYLRTRFGFDIIKNQWELMPLQRAIDAIKNSIINEGATFGDVFNQFGIWTFFTNYRAKPGEYFPEAADYPLIKPFTVLEFTPPQKVVKISSPPVANNFIEFVKQGAVFTESDTLFAIVSNTDTRSSINDNKQTFQFEFSLYNSPADGSVKINDNYYYKLAAENTQFWNVSEVLNNDTIGAVTNKINIDYAFPSPFSYKNNYYLFLPVDPGVTKLVDYNIYTSAMKLVFKGSEEATIINGQAVVKWNAKNENNEKLPSGVYIFVTKSGDNIKKGKLVIFND